MSESGTSEGQDPLPNGRLAAARHKCLCVNFPDACSAVNGPKLTDLEERELMKKWQEILGPSNEVMVRFILGGEGGNGWRGGGLRGSLGLFLTGGSGGEVQREQRPRHQPGGRQRAPLHPLGPPGRAGRPLREAVQRGRAAGGESHSSR